jgi:hypothetical protein
MAPAPHLYVLGSYCIERTVGSKVRLFLVEMYKCVRLLETDIRDAPRVGS